ncbi:hypothetical protein CG709_21535 [Lachnotalea glycerini]|nr:hypothetical protein CG709_21535 [Lachnotalea glycerini]
MMINYDPVWQTWKNKNVSTYAWINKLNISNGTLYRRRKGLPITTNTIDQFCKILNCSVEDIILYIDDSNFLL